MAKPYESLVRGDYTDEAGYHQGYDDRDSRSLVYRLAYALYCSRKSQPDWGRGYIPRWYEQLKLSEKYHAPAGFGVDFDSYVWCVRGQLAARAESLSYDDKRMQGYHEAYLDPDQAPVVPNREARLKLMASRKKG